MKYIAIDTETGGISNDTSLLTVYALILNDQLIPQDELYLYLKPKHKIYHVEVEALIVNGINLIEHDKIAITKSDGGQLFRDFLIRNNPNGTDKFIPIGQNIFFDLDKIYTHLLDKKEAEKYISYRLIDTGCNTQFLKTMGLIPDEVSGGLQSMVKHYGITQLPAHDAKNDVLMTIEVLKAQIEQIKNLSNK